MYEVQMNIMSAEDGGWLVEKELVKGVELDKESTSSLLA